MAAFSELSKISLQIRNWILKCKRDRRQGGSEDKGENGKGVIGGERTVPAV
jgi:hypothetical protein